MPQGYFPQMHRHSRGQTQNLSCRNEREFGGEDAGEVILGARQTDNIRMNFNLLIKLQHSLACSKENQRSLTAKKKNIEQLGGTK